jgi:uncharacterized protein (UPF0264 family)
VTPDAWWLPPEEMSCGLLVSVRDAAEADAALIGGATIIDVKEPDRGALGRADAVVAAAIAIAVGRRRPWTIAAGELKLGAAGIRAHLGDVLRRLPPTAARPVAVKVGLAGMGGAGGNWSAALLEFVAGMETGVDPVCVAYVDWQPAAAPAPEETISVAARHGCRGVLFDTFDKRGAGALEGPTADRLPAWIAAARGAGLAVALAGRIDEKGIANAVALRPDVLGFRSAACAGGRFGRICRQRVDRLGTLLRPAAAETDGSISGARV